MGRNGDTGTYGKHGTENLNFLVHKAGMGSNGDTGSNGKHQVENKKFFVHQHRPVWAEIGTPGPMASIRLKVLGMHGMCVEPKKDKIKAQSKA